MGLYDSSKSLKETRVDRPDEGLPGVATSDNPTANPPTRATLDRQRAEGSRVPAPKTVFDTSGTSGLDPLAEWDRQVDQDRGSEPEFGTT